MLDLIKSRCLTIIGGGTAGWFAALTLRKIFPEKIEIKLIESPDIGIVGVGEGALINLINALNHLEISTSEFMKETGATLKWGFCYEGWRTGGDIDDEFYHLFINPKFKPFNYERGAFYPLISTVIAKNIPLAHVVKDFEAILNRVSQEEAINLLMQDSGMATSFHFDSHKVSNFLSKKAVERGVTHIQGKVKDILFDDLQVAQQIIMEDGSLDTDFIIDATGFSRFVIGKKLNSKWNSFKEYLWLDRAIPFHIPHLGQNPELITRATAMKSGWMWRIPLIERIGAGYVYSSKYSTEQQAIEEIEKYLGFKISPQKTLSFEPGYFEQVWQKNVMALGLSSGFVEPLEATSIGQMLEQLKMFEKVIVQSGWIISDLSIDQFNQANASSWLGIRDFLRMHYDCPRRDTEFWQQVSKTPYPESYRALKEVFNKRLPRMQDVKGYAIHDWGGVFHVVNWIFVAQALGLISSEACVQELNHLPNQLKVEVVDYFNNINRLNN